MKYKKVLSAFTATAIAAGITVVPVMAEELKATAVISDDNTEISLSENVTGVVIGVTYQQDRINGIRFAEITEENHAVLEDFEADAIYVWDSFSSMKPLCEIVGITESVTEAPTEAAPAVKVIDFTVMSKASEYTEDTGEGFVEYSSAIMPDGCERQVAPVSEIAVSSDGAKVTETGAAYTHAKTNSDDGDDYNYGGMIYRVDTPAGAYHIEVEVTGSSSERE